ncbi:uncharacterized protein LOC144552668 isoform X2 [Carex rostrata]
MPRPRKGASKKPPRAPKSNNSVAHDLIQDPHKSFNKREVERRIAAVEAICEAETENLLSRLRYLRSYMTKEQLKMPALQFFKEHFPNLEVVRNEKYNVFELKWKDDIVCEHDYHGIGKNLRSSVVTSTGGLQFSVNSVRKNVLEAIGMDARNSVGASTSWQTPGAMSSRLSFGMTPKTVRLPMNGETLLSVRGSPLGVYKEDNLPSISTIHESVDGSPSGGS